jgi:DNA modification methylase
MRSIFDERRLDVYTKGREQARTQKAGGSSRGDQHSSAGESGRRYGSGTDRRRFGKSGRTDPTLFGAVLPESQHPKYVRADRTRPLSLEEQVKAHVTVGKATLFQADCLQWLSTQSDNAFHGVVTDPPYGLIEYAPDQQAKLRKGKGGVWRIPPSFDGHQRAPLPRFTVLTPRDLRELQKFFGAWARALYPKLVPGAHVLVASNPLVSYLVAQAIVEKGFERRGEVVRLVMTMRGGDRPKNAHEEFSDVTVMPRSMWEPWLLFRKPLEGRVQDNLRQWKTGGLRRPSQYQPFGDVIRAHPARPAEREIAPHPSLKPQEFLRQVVRAILPLGEGRVLDPFAGAGSTLAAAEAVGYESVGVEVDPHYVVIAKKAIARLAALDFEKPTGRGKSKIPGAS